MSLSAMGAPPVHLGPVLVIDDSLTIRKLLEMALTRAGQATEMASSGGEGLTLARRIQPSLILLDYVLPDMTGAAVCDKLDQDPLTADVPVVIMSGKGDDIRPLFKSRRTVAEVIAKPFSPATILQVIERAMKRTALAGASEKLPVEEGAVAALPRNGHPVITGGSPPTTATITRPASSPATGWWASGAPAAGLPTISPGTGRLVNGHGQRAEQEAAAKVLYGALRERLARVPEWAGEVANQAPAPFFARRLLTPEVVGAVLAGLTPLIANQPATTADTTLTPAAAVSSFTGSTTFLPVLTLLRLVADTHRTGVLRFRSESGDAVGAEAWFDRGDLVLAAPRDPGAARRVLTSIGSVEEPGRMAAWLATAQAADLPAAVVVAAAAGDAGRTALQQLGRQTLVTLAGGGPTEWTWSEPGALPQEVQQAACPIAIDQLLLDRLRLVDDWSQIELEVRSLGQICARTADFSERLRRFTLTVDERRVLQHVDGRRQVKDVLERTQISTFDVFHILYRLIQVRLLTTCADAAPLAAGSGPVLLCGASADTAQPLAAWLTQRPDGTRLQIAEGSGSAALAAQITAAHPRLVLIDLEVLPPAAAQAIAAAVREQVEISATALVALVPGHDRDLPLALTAAGFDQVLTKPVHLTAIRRLLDG